MTLAVQQEDLMVADGYDASLASDRTIVGIDFLVVGSDFFSYMIKPACMAGLTGDPKQLDEIELQARTILKDVTLARSGPRVLDVTPQGVHKALALAASADPEALKTSLFQKEKTEKGEK